MTELTKTCTKCGEPKNLKEFYRCSRSPDGVEWRCKACKVASAVASQRLRQMEINECARRRYADSPALRAERSASLSEWRRANAEKVRSQRTRAWRKFTERIESDQSAQVRYVAKRRRQYVKRIRGNDDYIKQLLVQKSHLKYSQIPLVLVQLKRQYLKVRRFINQKEQENEKHR